MITQLTAKNAEGVTGITRLGDAFRNLIIPANGATGAMGGLTSGIGSFMAVLAPAALAVAGFVAAVKTIEGLQSTFDAFEAKTEGDLGRVQQSYDKMIDSFQGASFKGPGPRDILNFFELFGIKAEAAPGFRLKR